MLRRVILFAACMTAALAADTASISGAVHDSVAGAPVKKIIVALHPAGGRRSYMVTTGADGSFSFNQVEPGPYRIAFMNPAYRSVPDNQAGAVTRLDPGQSLTGLKLIAMPLGSISGAVLGPDEEPLVEVAVHLVQIRWSHGRRIASELRYALTDDRGYYRFDSLNPGAYYVRANRQCGWIGIETVTNAPGQPEMALETAYYPRAATIAEASPVRVDAGQEASGIDLRPRYQRTFHIRGNLEHAGLIDTFTNKAPYPTVARDDGSNKDYAELGGWFREDGSFDIAGVPSGDFVVREMRGTEPLSSAAHVHVASADVTGVLISANRFDVHVTARFEGEPAHDLSKWSAALTPTDSTSPGLSTWPDRRNVIPNIAPGRYLFHVYPNEAAYVKQVSVGGKAASGSEIELSSAADQLEFVLARGPRVVQGQVEWPEPRLSAACVVLLPEQPRPGDREVVHHADLDQHGRFQFWSVPPGRFRALLVTGFDADLWENPDFYRSFVGQGLLVDVRPGTEDSPPIHIKPPLLPAVEVLRARERLGN